MHPLYSSQNLMQKFACISFLGTSMVDNVIEKFASTGILHDQIELSRRLDDLIQLNDVSTLSDELQNVNLTCNALNVGDVHYPLFF